MASEAFAAQAVGVQLVSAAAPLRATGTLLLLYAPAYLAQQPFWACPLVTLYPKFVQSTLSISALRGPEIKFTYSERALIIGGGSNRD